MTKNYMEFMAKLSDNWELAEKLSNETDPQVLIAAAKELGIEMTEADFAEKQEKISCVSRIRLA